MTFNPNKIFINNKEVSFSPALMEERPKFIIIPKSKFEEILNFIRESPETENYKIVARVYKSESEILDKEITLTEKVSFDGGIIELAFIKQV